MDTLEEPQPTHADLRSPSHAHTRHMKQSQKYYAFRSGPMSRVGQPILSVPGPLFTQSYSFASAPLLVRPEAVHIRTWTKQDQFMERTWDIYPLDRKDHKRGRKKRGRGCDYVPPRWKMERSMKERGRLVDEVEIEMDEEGAENAENWLRAGRCFLDCCTGPAFGYEVAGGELSHAVQEDDLSDADFDLLSDLDLEAGDSDWEIIE